MESAELCGVTRAPEERLRSREIGAGILDCVRGLLPSRCLAVVLYLQGHTTPEASRILGFTLRKTENLVFRGIADLRRCLAAKGLEP